jgi:ribosomal protein S18 acetylase RimI-like enzyme
MDIIREPAIGGELGIRSATALDAAAVTQIVGYAYRHYIPRMGRIPTPMLDNYAVRIAEGRVFVIEEGNTVFGVAVLVPRQDHLLLENIAVEPKRQGTGFGRRLLIFAETEAMRRGYSEIRLYTHTTMIENQELYAKIGYAETSRNSDRVFMCKQLRIADQVRAACDGD